MSKSIDRKHFCERCGAGFDYLSKLKVHVDSIHKKVKFICDFCDYQSTDKSNLQKYFSILFTLNHQCKKKNQNNLQTIPTLPQTLDKPNKKKNKSQQKPI